MVTLGQLLTRPELRLQIESEPAGCRSLPVTVVHSSELPSVDQWLAGGEVLLTIGAVQDLGSDAAADYIQRIHAAGAVALGIGLGRSLPNTAAPAALIAHARAVGLALFTVPEPVPFVAVVEAFTRLREAESAHEVSRLVRTQRRLATALAATGPAGLLGEVSRALDAPVVLTSPTGRLRASSSTGSSAGLSAGLRCELIAAAAEATMVPRLIRIPAAEAVGESASGEQASAESALGDQAPAEAVPGERAPAEVAPGEQAPAEVAYGTVADRAVMDRSGLGPGLEAVPVGTDQVSAWLLVPPLASRPGAERHTSRTLLLATAAALLGLQRDALPDRSDLAAQLCAGSTTGPAAGPSTDTELAERFHQCTGAALPEAVSFAIAHAPHGSALFESLIDDTDATVLHHATTSGTALICTPQLRPLVAAVCQATGARLGAWQTTAPAGVHALWNEWRYGTGDRQAQLRTLLSGLGSEAAAEFVHRTLGPLDAADSGGMLMSTLEHFVTSGGSRDAAAQALGIHRHTVRARLERIAGILGCDPREPAQLQALSIAFLLRSEPTRP